MTPEREIRIEIARSIISECEVLFSAQAWKFYQRSGRGYLYLHKVVNIQHEGGNNLSITESESVIKPETYTVQEIQLLVAPGCTNLLFTPSWEHINLTGNYIWNLKSVSSLNGT